MPQEQSQPSGPGISWPQVFGSALAAVTSAVLLSTLGVAGTLIGAAVGSVVVTIGTALYRHWLEVSRHRVAAQASALRRVAQAREHVGRAAAALDSGGPTPEATLRRADRALGKAEDALDDDASTPEDTVTGADAVTTGTTADTTTEEDEAADAGWFSWRRIALISAVVFVVAMLAITGFELLTGRAVSTYTGGSDQGTGSTLGVGTRKSPTPTPSDQPSSTPTPTSRPSGKSSPTPAPSSQPSPSESTLPAPTLTPTDSASPTSPG